MATRGVLASMAKLVASEGAQTIALRGHAAHGRHGLHPRGRDAALLPRRAAVEFSPLTNEMVRNRIGEQHLGLPRSY